MLFSPIVSIWLHLSNDVLSRTIVILKPFILFADYSIPLPKYVESGLNLYR